MKDSCGSYLLRFIAPVALAAVCVATAQAKTAAKADAAAMAQMSHEATRIFNDACNAVNALSSGNKAAALSDINTAMGVRDRLAATANSHNLPKVVPVFFEMDQDSLLDSTIAKKNNGKPVPSTKQPVTVDAAADQFTFVGIDLDRTRARLQGAKDAINNNNLQSAKDTLNSIGDDLVVEKVTADAPLLAIRENLGIAQAAVMKHQDREAGAALRQAAMELSDYAKNGPGPHAASAREMGYSVSRMLQATGQKDPSSSGQIGDWWVQVNNWMKSPAV